MTSSPLGHEGHGGEGDLLVSIGACSLLEVWFEKLKFEKLKLRGLRVRSVLFSESTLEWTWVRLFRIRLTVPMEPRWAWIRFRHPSSGE